MYKIFNIIVLILIVSSCYSQKKPNVYEMQPLYAREELSGLNVSIAIDTIQHLSELGIQFQIRMENKGEKHVSIKNMSELSNFGLFDEANKNIMYPRIPRVLIHSVGSVDYVEPFKVTRAKINGKNMADTHVLKEAINIPAGGFAEISLKIDSVLGRDAQKPYYRKDLIKLKLGLYYLTGWVLINNDKKNIPYQTDPLNLIKIRYK